MAQITHAINGERPPQEHGTTQSACRAQTSLLMPPVEHERGSVCSVAEPWQHKLVFAVLKPARGIMSLPLASRIPPPHGMEHAWGRGCRWSHVEGVRPPEAEIPRSNAWPCLLVVPTHELQIQCWKHELADIPLALRMRCIRCGYPECATILQVALWPNG